MNIIAKFTVIALILTYGVISPPGSMASTADTLPYHRIVGSGSGINVEMYRSLVMRYGSLAKMIAHTTAEEINLVYVNEGFSGNFPLVEFNASYTPTNNGAKIDLNWTSTTWFYPPGEYRIDSTAAIACNHREAIAFIEIIKKAIYSARAKMAQAGLTNYHIEATFTGSADGLTIRRPIHYNGEYGRVVLTNHTTLNDRSHRFFISPGQSIDNEELAALRAVSLAAYLHGRLGRLMPLSDRFVITTSRHRGAKYRTADVSITILDN